MCCQGQNMYTYYAKTTVSKIKKKYLPQLFSVYTFMKSKHQF